MGQTGGMKTRRLFAGVAVAATEEMRGWGGELRGGLRGEGIRWARLENLHVTVEFFGEVGEERMGGLAQALGRAAAGAQGFPLRLAGVGTFGGALHPRVLWLGVESAGLRDLHGRVAAALREAGWEPEAREYRPHLTLGRIDRLEDLRRFTEVVSRCRAPETEAQGVRELILYESAAGRHVPLARWELGGC